MTTPNILPTFYRTAAGIGTSILLLAGCTKSNPQVSVEVTPSERTAAIAHAAVGFSCDLSTFISGAVEQSAPNGSMDFQATSTGSGVLSMIRFTAIERTTGAQLPLVDAAPGASGHIIFPAPDVYTVTARGYADTLAAGEISAPCKGGLVLAASPTGLELLSTL